VFNQDSSPVLWSVLPKRIWNAEGSSEARSTTLGEHDSHPPRGTRQCVLQRHSERRKRVSNRHTAELETVESHRKQTTPPPSNLHTFRMQVYAVFGLFPGCVEPLASNLQHPEPNRTKVELEIDKVVGSLRASKLGSGYWTKARRKGAELSGKRQTTRPRSHRSKTEGSVSPNSYHKGPELWTIH
jgi:hypothetical protein